VACKIQRGIATALEKTKLILLMNRSAHWSNSSLPSNFYIAFNSSLYPIPFVSYTEQIVAITTHTTLLLNASEQFATLSMQPFVGCLLVNGFSKTDSSVDESPSQRLTTWITLMMCGFRISAANWTMTSFPNHAMFLLHVRSFHVGTWTHVSVYNKHDHRRQTLILISHDNRWEYSILNTQSKS
jgi:hypothetical protein